MTRIIANTVYVYMNTEMYNLPPIEQRRSRRNSRGAKDKLLADKMVLNDCKKRQTNLGVAQLDYKKAYAMISYSWILKSLVLMQVSQNIVKFIRKVMKNCNKSLASYGKYLANNDIRRGIFQGHSLSPLLFVIFMISLTQTLRKVKSGYTLKNGEYLNHILFMDDLKIYAKTGREGNGLVSTVQILSNNIGMEVGIQKCGILIYKRAKVVSSKVVEMPHGS